MRSADELCTIINVLLDGTVIRTGPGEIAPLTPDEKAALNAALAEAFGWR